MIKGLILESGFMDIIFYPLFSVMLSLINLYTWGLFVYVVLTWLEHFNILNRFNSVVYNVHGFLFRLYEPALSRIRDSFSSFAGIDLSPLILWFGLMLLEGIIARILIRIF